MTDSNSTSLEIGIRGLLILESAKNYRYYPDNAEETWAQFPVMDLEKFAAQRGIQRQLVEALTASRAPIALCNAEPRTFLVNLDAFQSLPEADARPRLTPISLDLGGSDDVYLIHEHARYYAVGAPKLGTLDYEDAAYAEALVKRGVVAAALPKNSIPIGTHCVLINLPELLPPELLSPVSVGFGDSGGGESWEEGVDTLTTSAP